MRLSEIPRNPGPSTLRNFGLLFLLIFGGVAALQVRKSSPSPEVYAILALSCLIGLTAILRPLWLRVIFVSWMFLVFPIGWTISHLALGLLFYGVFTPLGIVFRLIGRDRLRLRREPAASEDSSYWTPKQPIDDPGAYFRQF